MRISKYASLAALAAFLWAGAAWAAEGVTASGVLNESSQEMTQAVSALGQGDLEGASATTAKAFDRLTLETKGGVVGAVAGKESGVTPLCKPSGKGPKADAAGDVPPPASPAKPKEKEGGILGIGREVGQFVGGIFGSLTGWYMGGVTGQMAGGWLADKIALNLANGLLAQGKHLTAFGAYYGAATAGGFLGSVFGTVGGYVVGTVLGTELGSRIGKWFDGKKKP